MNTCCTTCQNIKSSTHHTYIIIFLCNLQILLSRRNKNEKRTTYKTRNLAAFLEGVVCIIFTVSNFLFQFSLKDLQSFHPYHSFDDVVKFKYDLHVVESNVNLHLIQPVSSIWQSWSHALFPETLFTLSFQDTILFAFLLTHWSLLRLLSSSFHLSNL